MTKSTRLMLQLIILYLVYSKNIVESSGYSGRSNQGFELLQTEPSPAAYPWLTHQTPTLYQCVEPCRYMAICGSLVFYKNMSECHLYSDILIVSLPGGSSGVYVINATDVPQVVSGTCGTHNCSTGTRCVPRNNGHVCVQIDFYCAKPPTIALASISNLYQAHGATVRYNCIAKGDLYLPQGSPEITCLETRNWTTTSFYCKDAWKCSRWTGNDYRNFASYDPVVVCEEHGIINRRFTGGYNSLAPGCGQCYCCERI